jgi:type III pantothenate kinase
MARDYLLIDVGNGRTKLALSSREKILDRREIASAKVTPAGLKKVLKGWSYERVVMCSVVPKVSAVLRKLFGGGRGRPRSFVELRHDTLMGIGIRYPKPERIGADRLANAVALAHLHGAPGIVIDFGTAVTFDIVSARKEYIGGVIAPGLRLMTDYLHERTALLPRVELKEPPGAIGRSTEDAILAGAAIGYRGMIAGLLDAVRREMKARKLTVVATGGDASWIIAGMGRKIVVDPDLTLHGLRLVGNLNA